MLHCSPYTEHSTFPVLIIMWYYYGNYPGSPHVVLRALGTFKKAFGLEGYFCSQWLYPSPTHTGQAGARCVPGPPPGPGCLPGTPRPPPRPPSRVWAQWSWPGGRPPRSSANMETLEAPCTLRDWPGSGCGSASSHFSTMTPCDWAGPLGPGIDHFNYRQSYLVVTDLALQPPGHAHHEGNIRAENLDRERRHCK